jgi:hypothetical protein
LTHVVENAITHPQAKRDSIKVKIALNERVKTIVKNVNVSSSALYNYKKNLRQFNALKPLKVLPQGHPHKITYEMERVYVKDIDIIE